MTRFEYDELDRIEKTTYHDGHSTATTYDKNGNAETLLVPTQVTHSFTANGVNKVKTNAIGNRVAKLVDGVVVEKYLWLNKTTLAAIYDKDDNLVQRFEYSIGNTPVSFTQDGNKYYITSDHLGSPRTISDVSGNVLKAIEYDSFGNVISDTNSALKIPFGFAGGLYDKDTNLLRFGYRDYDPETGKWTARDPIGFAGGDTNLYGYVASDPVNFVDPGGLFSLAQGLTVIGIATTAKGIYDNHQNQRELRDMRESINHADNVVKGCVSGKCPMPYSDLPSYVDALDRVKKTYIEKTGKSGFDLAESLSGKKTGSNQLPKTLPFCD